MKLTAAQLDELGPLIGGSDSIELKLTVPEDARRTTIQRLGLDPLEAEIRQVYFFDTPELALDAAGVVARARRVQGDVHDTVVKLRPVVPADVPDHLRKRPECKVEVDVIPGAFVCSASLKGEVGPNAIKNAVVGKRTIGSLFSKEQQAFFADNAPEGVGLDDLSILGPIFVMKAKSHPPDFGRKLVAELWMYPGGNMVLELSTKCLPGEGRKTAAEAKQFLEGRGLMIGGGQQTKTKGALQFFSKELQAAAAAAAAAESAPAAAPSDVPAVTPA